MARRLAWVLAIVTLGATCRGQDLPRPTEVGVARMVELIEACIEAGGLARPAPGGSGAKLPPVADPSALREAVARFRDRLTPELRDALIGVRPAIAPEESPAHLSLLEAVGRSTGDDRALAFAALFAGDAEWQAGRFDRSERSFREARRLFARVGDRAWEARSRHQQAILHESAGLYSRAAEGFREALTLFESNFGEGHPMVPACLQGLGSTLHSLGDDAGAIRALDRAGSLLGREGGPADLAKRGGVRSLPRADLGAPAAPRARRMPRGAGPRLRLCRAGDRPAVPGVAGLLTIPRPGRRRPGDPRRGGRPGREGRATRRGDRRGAGQAPRRPRSGRGGPAPRPEQGPGGRPRPAPGADRPAIPPPCGPE